MNENIRSLLFLTVMALVVGNGLAGISLSLGKRIDENKQFQKVKSLLTVMEVDGLSEMESEGKGADEFLKLYEKVIKEEIQGGVRVYTYSNDGIDEAYAFEVAGRGLWDKVKGFLAVEKDGMTVRSISFFEQQETPGLGGEIASVEFARRFEGKKIRDADGFLKIVKAGTIANLSSIEVDGITGATMTGDAVNVFLADDIERFVNRNIKPKENGAEK
ncbi:MAG: FMN-binding protein [Planctomycetota bacterium]|jgi:Na+-transporting NADH:ubiquinone oxidoreductase subunit C